jgi:hypothetical protein
VRGSVGRREDVGSAARPGERRPLPVCASQQGSPQARRWRCKSPGAVAQRVSGALGFLAPQRKFLACCTCLSYRRRYTTALTHRRPQRYSELGEESPGRARDKHARLCARPPAECAKAMASAGVSGLWPVLPAWASAAGVYADSAARRGSMRPSPCTRRQRRRVWQVSGFGALLYRTRQAATIL